MMTLLILHIYLDIGCAFKYRKSPKKHVKYCQADDIAAEDYGYALLLWVYLLVRG